MKKESFQYVVNARGQERSVKTDPSDLMRNLIASGAVHLAEPSRSNGSIQIDPATHRVIRRRPEGAFAKSRTLYAVGAMTRDQIIDASMAKSIVEAVYKVTEDLMKDISDVVGV